MHVCENDYGWNVVHKWVTWSLNTLWHALRFILKVQLLKVYLPHLCFCFQKRYCVYNIRHPLEEVFMSIFHLQDTTSYDDKKSHLTQKLRKNHLTHLCSKVSILSVLILIRRSFNVTRLYIIFVYLPFQLICFCTSIKLASVLLLLL